MRNSLVMLLVPEYVMETSADDLILGGGAGSSSSSHGQLLWKAIAVTSTAAEINLINGALCGNTGRSKCAWYPN
ncbi:hypothetical protein ACVBEG_26715 [Pseudomonas sp. GG8]